MSPLFYYALIANLLYTFNLVNYTQLNETAREPLDASSGTQNESLTTTLEVQLDPESMIFEPSGFERVFGLSQTLGELSEAVFKGCNTNISQLKSQTRRFSPILLWAVAFYFLTIQVYNLWHQHQMSILKRSLILLGLALALYMEYAPISGSSSDLLQYLDQYQLYDLLFGFSILVNLLLLTILYMRRSKAVSGPRPTANGFTHLRSFPPQPPAGQRRNNSQPHHQANPSNASFEVKRTNASFHHSSPLMSRYIGGLKSHNPTSSVDYLDGTFPGPNTTFDETDNLSVASTAASELSSIYCSSVHSGLLPLSNQARIQAFAARLRATYIPPTTPPPSRSTPPQTPFLEDLISVSDIDETAEFGREASSDRTLLQSETD